MRPTRLLFIPLIMLFLLACGLTNGIRQIQQAVTQLPEVLTSAPTALGAIGTLVATAMPSNECPAVPAAGGLGVSFVNTKALLQTTQQFTFTDGSLGGQPVSTATLASAAAGTYSAISDGFSAQSIGDPCNLSEIKIIVPRTDQQASVDQGIQAVNLVLIAPCPWMCSSHLCPGCRRTTLPWSCRVSSGRPRGRTCSSPCKGIRPACCWTSCRRNRFIRGLRVLLPPIGAGDL